MTCVLNCPLQFLRLDHGQHTSVEIGQIRNHRGLDVTILNPDAIVDLRGSRGEAEGCENRTVPLTIRAIEEAECA